MAVLEIKQPVRGINGGDRSIGTSASRSYPTSATTSGGQVALANEFTGGSRLAGRPHVPQSPRQGTARRSKTAPSLRTVARTIIP